MAGTVTFEQQQFFNSKGYGELKKITISWTSDASGDADGTSEFYVSGAILRAVINPGSAAPTASYDITLKDENEVDILAGQGADLSATATTHLCPGMALEDGTTTSVVPIAVCDKLTLDVSNAGDSKNGTIVLYVA